MWRVVKSSSLTNWSPEANRARAYEVPNLLLSCEESTQVSDQFSDKLHQGCSELSDGKRKAGSMKWKLVAIVSGLARQMIKVSRQYSKSPRIPIRVVVGTRCASSGEHSRPMLADSVQHCVCTLHLMRASWPGRSAQHLRRRSLA